MQDLSDWKGCERPHRKVFEGRFVRLEPLDVDKHGDGLFEAATAGDADERFRWLTETTPQTREEFQSWLERVQVSEDPMYFAVIDLKTGKVAGRQTMMRMDPANGVAEIGHIHWGPLIQKTPATTEAYYLFASHVFDELGYRRFEWKCNNRNEPSKDAALRYGMTAEGVHRQLMVVKGENRDTAWYSLLDYEWPKAGEAMRLWLDPENFDANGKQIRRLEEIRRSL
ncbi:MAG: GNAT family protein [Rhizobiaceae bacterium]|nr:GNAT family protein [Rhizobiaceae bacterium]